VPEEDDDEPILGGDVEVESTDRGDPGGKRRRRRRRRGGRGAQDEDNGLPSYTVSDAPLLVTTDEEESLLPGIERRPAKASFSAC